MTFRYPERVGTIRRRRRLHFPRVPTIPVRAAEERVLLRIDHGKVIKASNPFLPKRECTIVAARNIDIPNAFRRKEWHEFNPIHLIPGDSLSITWDLSLDEWGGLTTVHMGVT